MSLSKQIQIIRANYSVRFTLQHLYYQHINALAEALDNVPEDQREAFRREFIEKHHELRLVVSRLSDEEKRQALTDANKARDAASGSMTAWTEAYQKSMWPKVRRHIEKAFEKIDAGTFTEVDKKTLNEWLDAIEKQSLDEISFIITAYIGAESEDKKKAEGDRDFLEKAS